MAQFDLQIRDIYGQVVGTWKPLDCELSVTQNDTGSITGGFGRSDPTVTRNFFGPYRNDWFLYRDNRLLKSGPITNAGWSDQTEGMITMAGKTWEHLLDRRIWYFDPEEPNSIRSSVNTYIVAVCPCIPLTRSQSCGRSTRLSAIY